jgi:hypothetical protein
MSLVKTYKEVDQIIATGGVDLSQKLQPLIDGNPLMVRNYFYAHAPIDLVGQLYKEGFFSELKELVASDALVNRRNPELQYLVRVSNDGGDESVLLKIMNEVQCTEAGIEVVNQFMWIAQSLSVESTLELVPKIVDENWVLLMQAHNPSGFIFEKVVKKVANSGDYDKLLSLAKVIFTPLKDKDFDDYFGSYFVLSHIGDSGIFKALESLQGEYAQRCINMIFEILRLFVRKNDKSSRFANITDFSLYDVDLFTLTVSHESSRMNRDDLNNAVALLVVLVREVFSGCDPKLKQYYNETFESVPDARVFWRLRLFSMSLCPELFLTELSAELNGLFNAESYSDYLAGTEYYKALKATFPYWEDKDQRLYIKNVFTFFSDLMEKEPRHDWLKDYGWRVISSIPFVEPSEEEECEKLFGKKPSDKFEPKPSISSSVGGFVADRSPTPLNDKSVDEVLQLLKNDLAPMQLSVRYANEPLLDRRSAEGVGDTLREDVKARIGAYLDQSIEILNEAIHIHYTYSFLRGVEGYLREDNKLTFAQWDKLLALFEKVKNSNPDDYVQGTDDRERGWLAKWTWIEESVASLLKYYLMPEYKDGFPRHREAIYGLLSYLLESEDPSKEYEDSRSSDYYHIAINSTRGVAFEAFVNFIYQEGKELKPDVLELYKKTVKVASPSVRFVIGRYLASFYYRSPSAITPLFPDIFPEGELFRQEFSAGWEGYLSGSLYPELFEALTEHYLFALEHTLDIEKERRRFQDPDKGLAVHIALAFAHFKHFHILGVDVHPTFKALLESKRVKVQKEFVTFLGHRYLSKESKIDERWIHGESEDGVDVEKFKQLWELLLKEDLDKEVYCAFGSWIAKRHPILEKRWVMKVLIETLRKANGFLEYDYGLVDNLQDFAEIDPSLTIDILRLYLVEGLLGHSPQTWYRSDQISVELFKFLYSKERDKTTELIEELLEKGGSAFWRLKDVPIHVKPFKP